MEFYKKWWFWVMLVIIVLLLVFIWSLNLQTIYPK